MKFFTNVILENIENNVIDRPIFKIDEIEAMNDKTLKSLSSELEIPKDVMNSFMVKDILNPDIWNDKKLDPEVKTSLIKIAKDFFLELELPKNIKIKDILFVGSLANYNWSKYSDVDLHLVLDFNEFKDNPDLIKKHFDAEKNLWNNKHDIMIKGFPVEIYIQDLKEKLEAAAIYSVPHEKWIRKPNQTELKIDKNLIRRKVQKLFDKIRNIRKDYEAKDYDSVIKKVDMLKEDIKAMRKSGLERGGEFSIENIVFKVLRRTDFMDLLDSYKIKSYDQSVTVTEEMP